ncbi:MAG: YbaN family protein [Devosia sp.]|nr:MAG: YbaN family protein [Devosia sp.]
MLRPFYLIAGLVLTALGIIGAFLPLMPTTIFLILAAGCFTRSSPKLENWLLNHARFGPTLRNWRQHGAIAPRAKLLASMGITLGVVCFWIVARPPFWWWLAGAGFMGGSLAYVLSRPNGPRVE